MFFHKLVSLASLALAVGHAKATPLDKRACTKYLDAASEAAANLQSRYFINGGYPHDQQWVWISANDNFYLRQLDQLTGSPKYTHVVDTVFNGWEQHLTYGGSYDDLLWVVISYLKSGNVGAAARYYDLASAGQDSQHCGGGLFWSSKRSYKNAITNELFIAASGYMYEVTKDQKYLDNAKTTWDWFKTSKMRSPDNGLYNDGLVLETCENNHQTQWTYNQGVILVGLAYLSKYDTPEAVDFAFGIMDAIIQDLAPNNGLKESCDSPTETKCNLDQQTFKGITTMYMAWFLQVTGRDSAGKYSAFIKAQGDKILNNAVGEKGWYSNLWYAPNEGGAVFNMQTQGSALGGLVAAAMQNC